MSEAVVDLLETVNVNEKYREFMFRMSLGTVEFTMQTIQKQNTIGQLCQRVMHRLVEHLLLRPLAFGRNCHEIGCSFRKIQLKGTRLASVTAVNVERTHYRAACGQDRQGPEGTESVTQRKLAVILPGGIAGEIGDYYGFACKGCGTNWAGAQASTEAEASCVCLGQAGSRCLPQPAIRIKK